MLLALDYDETYTRDPVFWDKFIQLARMHGHAVICATMRYNNYEADEVINALSGKVDSIVFTGRQAKNKAVHKAGYSPNVWIDDSPNFIIFDAAH